MHTYRSDHPALVNRKRARLGAVAGLALLLALTACGAPEPSAPASPDATADSEVSPTGESEPTEEQPEPAESFLAWLEASRKPDVDAACGVLTDALVDRMLAEMAATGFEGIDTCEEMIEVTAGLYKAAGSSAEVSIDVQEASDTDAVLFVTYTDTGKCGTVVMTWENGQWMITEQTEECAQA